MKRKISSKECWEGSSFYNYMPSRRLITAAKKKKEKEKKERPKKKFQKSKSLKT